MIMTRQLPHPLTIFTTTWCGYCTRLKRLMDREGIGYQEVNIEMDPAAAEFVMNVNGGNQTVPTVLFPDGGALTNPNINDVRRRIATAS
jgi:mycoredoxin